MENAYCGFVQENMIPYHFVDRHYARHPSDEFIAILWHVCTNDHLDELYLQIENNVIVIKMLKGTREKRSKKQNMRTDSYDYLSNHIGVNFKKKTIESNKWIVIGYIEFD